VPDSAVRFMITCPARTGSTMLTRCLRSHPETCTHGEVFSPEGPTHLDGLPADMHHPLDAAMVRLRDRDPVAFLHDVVFEAGDRKAVGFKFKYEELGLRPWRKVRTAIVKDRAVRIVHLTRENLLERFLSAYVAVNVTHVFNVARVADQPEPVLLRLSPEACAKDFEVTLRRQERAREMFSGHPILEVTYESLVSRRVETLALVEEFLGIEVCDLGPKTRKLRTSAMSEVIENYTELERHFAGTPYASFFIEPSTHNRTSPSGES
jgi:LPS sulfotransferase NodH